MLRLCAARLYYFYDVKKPLLQNVNNERVIVCIPGRIEGDKEGAIPRATSHYGAPNQCSERPMAAGVPASPNNVTSTFFNMEHTLPKDLSFAYGGAKLASCPGRNLSSLRPCLYVCKIVLI